MENTYKNARQWIVRIATASLLATVIGCASPSSPMKTDGGESFLRKTNLKAKGFRRTYLVHLPTGYSAEKNYPLVIAIHGAFSTDKKMEAETKLSEYADKEGFIVAYPNGMGIFGLLQHWNAGHCCGKAAKDDIDDVGFLATVIEQMKTKLPVDPNRIYMIGFSNGGMLAHRYAAERPETLSAVACVAATIGGRTSAEDPFWQIPAPTSPVPMLMIHSRTDTHVPYDGGRSPHRFDDPREYLSIDQATSFWATQNHCAPRPTTTKNGTVEQKTWQTNEREMVTLYSLNDWPHTWPGPYFNRSPEDAKLLGDFDATKTIWQFFEAH